MKKAQIIIASAIMLAFSLPVYADDKPMIYEGVQELSLAGELEFASAAGTEVSLDGSYGYFLADGFQVGGLLGFSDNDLLTTWVLGGQAEYNIDTQSKFVPFVGVRGGWIYLDPDQGSSDDGYLLGASAGMKYFFVPNIAISLSYLFEWSSEDVFLDDNEAEDTNHSIQLGMRFYF